MIKIRVQCLPEHIGKTKASIEKNFKIHLTSQVYPQKNSDFVRIYIEATPLVADQLIRVESVIDLIQDTRMKFTADANTQKMLRYLENEILLAVDPEYVGATS